MGVIIVATLTNGYETQAERSLWCAVLSETIKAATARCSCTDKDGYDQSSARRFLTQPSEDLEMVCAFTGVDVDELIIWAKNMRAMGWPRERFKPFKLN